MGPPGTLARPNVLAVDDSPANLLALEAVLGDDYELIFASSGAEALEVIRQRDDIDVVLMDVQMPGMDGFETVERMKQIAGRKDVPIVFISAVFTEDPYIKRGYAVGGI